MTVHLGDIPAGTTLYIPFTTYDANGASVSCSGLAVTDIEIYKNGSMTQRSSDAGIALLDTDGIDVDGVTGLHGFSINLSDNTDAGYYAVGGWFWVVVSAITVASQTVVFIPVTFRIVAAETSVGTKDVGLVDGAITGPKLAANSGLKPLYVGAVTSGSGTAYVVSGISVANDDINGYRIRMTSGAMIGQVRMVKDWVLSTTTLSLDFAFTTALSAADTFVIEAAQVNLKHVNDAIAAGVSALEVDVVSLDGSTIDLGKLVDFVTNGYNATTHKVQGVVLTDTVTTYTGNTPQTGDSFARIGSNGAGLTALATAAQVSSLQVNTRANIQVPIEIEIPDASTQVWKIRLFLFDEDGNMEAPDSTPTIALTNAAGTNRASRLSSATTLSTGAYSWDYTATAGDAEEQLVWVFTVVEGGLTRIYPATSYVVEETAYRFSSTDRATLNAAATTTALAAVNTKLGTPAGASVSADIAAAKVDTAATLAAAILVKQMMKNKVDVLVDTPSAGLYTYNFRNDDDTATVASVVFNPATGERP